jgi:hypothetical protein
MAMAYWVVARVTENKLPNGETPLGCLHPGQWWSCLG